MRAVLRRRRSLKKRNPPIVGAGSDGIPPSACSRSASRPEPAGRLDDTGMNLIGVSLMSRSAVE